MDPINTHVLILYEIFSLFLLIYFHRGYKDYGLNYISCLVAMHNFCQIYLFFFFLHLPFRITLQ